MTEPKHISVKMNLESMDIAKEKRERLKTYLSKTFPEAFNEDALDFDQLKRLLGEWIEPGIERFGLNWQGKALCLKIIQQPSVATLKPVRSKSVEFDTTENLFIEGENLEVLKLLQKSYFGKVKMIYIDPPYNTGKEFIYPDKYSETLKAYLSYTGQIDEDGNKFSTNTDTAGRYHTNWLNMMYPRLYLAKNLLREDGVIFISIDDNEQANLKMLCDQIFGEENFVTQCAWRRSDNQANIGKIARVKEYIIGYAKNTDSLSLNKMKLTERAKEEYSYPDKNGLFFRRAILLDKTRGRHTYEVKTPSGKTLFGPWMKKKDEFWKMDKENKIFWTSKGDEHPYGKIYLHESKGQIANDFLGIEYGTNQQASLEVEKLFNKRFFDFPKPVSLIKHFLTIGTTENDIILDFFAGSCTTAHSVMRLNEEDGGTRKYICVQLPEPIDKKSEAYKAGFKTIADIGIERIRRAGKKIEKEQNNKLALNKNSNLDIGFKMFKLCRSNFKLWEGDVSKNSNLEQQILNHIDHINSASTPEDILYELLLKSGFKLTTSIKKLRLAGKDVFSIEDGAMLICLDKNLTQEVIDALADKKPFRVICLDEGFSGNDQLKTNAVQTFKSRDNEIEFETV